MRFVEEIIKTYENHPSIKLIKDNVLSELNPKKATGPDKIRLSKIVKVAVNIIDSYLTNIINKDLSRNSSSNSAKVVSVRPIFKKDNRANIKNYRPISLFNCFSKIYEKFSNEQLLHFVNHSLSLISCLLIEKVQYQSYFSSTH